MNSRERLAKSKLMKDNKKTMSQMSSRYNSKNKTIKARRTIPKKTVTETPTPQRAEPFIQSQKHQRTPIKSAYRKKQNCNDQKKASIGITHSDDLNETMRADKESRRILNHKLIWIAVGTIIGVLLGLILIGLFSMLVNKKSDVRLNGLTRNKGIKSNKLQISVTAQNSTRASLNTLTPADHAENQEYYYCKGNGKSPGFVDLALTLSNLGQYQMDLKKIEVQLLEFTPVKNGQYSNFFSEKAKKTNLDASYYCLIDPALPSADAHPSDTSGKGEQTRYVEAEKQNQAKTMVSSESKNYGLKLNFTNYGIYRLKIRVRYLYNGKYLYSESTPDLRIIYDSK